jgi:predicted Zn-dependent peptidase
MEKTSSSGGSARFVCKECGKEFDSPSAFGGHIGSHIRKRRREELLAKLNLMQPPSPPALTLTPPPSQPPTVTPPSVSPALAQAYAGLTPPPAPQYDVGGQIAQALLSRLLEGGKSSEFEAKARESYMKFLDKIFNMPLSFLEGMGAGLKDGIKSYVKEALKEELSSIRGEIEELVKRYAGKKEAGSQAGGVEHSEEAH